MLPQDAIYILRTFPKMDTIKLKLKTKIKQKENLSLEIIFYFDFIRIITYLLWYQKFLLVSFENRTKIHRNKYTRTQNY